MKTMKKFLAALVVMCMVMVMPNITALADEPYVPTTGTGTEEDPVVWDQGPTVSYSQAVPAGQKLYVLAYGMGDYVITIESETAYVIVGETKYEPVEGKIEAPITIGRAAYFYIGNSGTEDATYVVSFVAPAAAVGTPDNPHVLEEAGYYTAEIEAGNSSGYFFQYVPTTDGVVCVSVTGAYDANWETLGWTYTVNNLSTYAYGAGHASSESPAIPGEFVAATAGDEIQIIVNTFNPADPWNAPAGSVEVSVSVKAGTEEEPLQIMGEAFTQAVPVNGSYYYQVYNVAGSNLIIEDENVQVIYNGQEYSANEEGVVSVEMLGLVYGFADTFQIKNLSEESKVEILGQFVYPEGHQNNPKEIETGKHEITLETDNAGYYYEWTAPADGLLTVGATAEGGWLYGVGYDTYYSDDEVLTPSTTVEVYKGETVTLYVGTYKAPEEEYGNPSYPAGTVTTTVSFEEVALVDEDTTSTLIDEIYGNRFSETPVTGLEALYKIDAFDDETETVIATVIPVEVLNAIKTQDMYVLMDMGYYGWLVWGEGVVNANAVDLGVTLDSNAVAADKVAAVANGNDTYQFSIAHDGDFGFTAGLILSIGEEYVGKTVALYWDNAGTLEKVGTCEVDEDGMINYAMTHASDYVLVVEGTASEIIPEEGDFPSTMILVLLGAALVSAGFVAKKRFA